MKVEQKYFDALDTAICILSTHSEARKILKELPALIRTMQDQINAANALLCLWDKEAKDAEILTGYSRGMAFTFAHCAKEMRKLFNINTPQAAAALTLSTKTLQQVASETCDEVIDRKNPRYVFTPDDLLVFVAALQESKHLQAAAPDAPSIEFSVDHRNALQYAIRQNYNKEELVKSLREVESLLIAAYCDQAAAAPEGSIEQRARAAFLLLDKPAEHKQPDLDWGFPWFLSGFIAASKAAAPVPEGLLLAGCLHELIIDDQICGYRYRETKDELVFGKPGLHHGGIVKIIPLFRAIEAAAAGRG